MFPFKKNKPEKKHRESNKEKKSSEIFTYFIPSPPMRPTGYREKDFDTICKIIKSHNLELKILKTIAHQNGMWVIINIIGDKNSLESVFEDHRLKELSINMTPVEDEHFSSLIERD